MGIQIYTLHTSQCETVFDVHKYT